MDDPLQPLVLCMENENGAEVALKIESNDNFGTFLEKAKDLLGFEVDINSLTGDQSVSLDDNIYNFLLNSEDFKSFDLSTGNYENINNANDLEYILDDGTQIKASQIQFDNDDPIVDLTAENIPFVKYTCDSDTENDLECNNIFTTKNINIVESPVQHTFSKNCSPKSSFANSLPFKLVCNNISNFDAQFSKYLEYNTKTYANLNNVVCKNKSPRSIIKDNYKYESNDIMTREDVLNMFKDSPVTSLPYDDNHSFEKRKNVRKTDPSRLVQKTWDTKTVPELNLSFNDRGCFICGKIVDSQLEKSYLFDKEDQMLHRCEQRKISKQLKIICEQCLSENFTPSLMKSPSESLNNDEYLVIKNNQQYIFQKTTSLNLKRFNCPSKIGSESAREKVEFVKVEIGPDGEIITKPIDNDERSDDVIIVKDAKKDNSSDVEIIEPTAEIEDIENLDDTDEEVQEFLEKYQCEDNNDNTELKCRFCKRVFENLSEVIFHGEEHKESIDNDIVYPCPLCDYGYANYKWLKGHLKAAHDKLKKEEKQLNNDTSNKEHPEKCSPVARRTRSSFKKNGCEQDEKGKENQESEEMSGEKVEPTHTLITEVKQECLDTSDEEGIWIVQAGDSSGQQHVIEPKGNEDLEDGVIEVQKCSNCSEVLPPSDSLLIHKCKKRGRKRKYFSNDATIFVPSEEDFLKRAHGRLQAPANLKDNEQMKVRKKKNRGPSSDPQIVTCHNCNESFTSKVRLKFHMQFHDTTNLMTAEGEYTCVECDDAKFSTETELFDHVHFQHDKQKRWQCPVKDCGKTFFLRATLTKHSRTHTDTRRYVCVTCGKRFLDKQTLDEHGVTHLQIKPFQCHICLKQLTRRSRLRMHLRAHEEELSPKLVFVCAVCSRAFRDRVDAQEHAQKSVECAGLLQVKEEELSPTSGLVRHHSPEYFRLNKTIEREAKAEESGPLLAPLDEIGRILIRVVNIEKAFRCEYCEDVFYLEDALNSHRTIHKGVKNPFTCHICKVSFATYSRCTTHKTTHGFYKRSATETRKDFESQSGPVSAGILGYGGFPVAKHFLCEDCGRSYLHWTYLQVHRRMKHANEHSYYKCNQCDMNFPNSWSAATHRKKVHGQGDTSKILRENYRIPCRDCDEILPNKIELYKHRQKEHSDMSISMNKEDEWSDHRENTICSTCGHNLHNVTALQKHIKEVHGIDTDTKSRLREHSCPECSRVFRSASVRDEHLRVHTGERPFPCDLCGVAFRRNTAMRNHRLIHSGARAWPCARCPRRFRVRSDLRTHTRLKHPAHLAVIEIEGLNPSPEEVQAYLTLNNIDQDKVIEITMISFAKGTTSIIPHSARALAMLGDVPRKQIVCERPPLDVSEDVFQPRRGRGIAKAQRRPKILRTETTQDPYPIELNVDSEGLSSLNVQLFLQDGALVNGNQMIQPPLDDGMLLE